VDLLFEFLAGTGFFQLILKGDMKNETIFFAIKGFWKTGMPSVFLK
jgi:hypothetical protein